MSESLGRSMPLSAGRRVVCDLTHASMKIPLIPIQKNVNVTELVSARNAASPRPSWCSIFTKAYARVVAARADLRRAYLSFPCERLYECSTVSADIALDVRLEDENVVAFVPLKNPESRSLVEIDQTLTSCKSDPVGQLPRYRRLLRLARFPRVVRNLVWWSILNLSGQKRARYVGAFGVSSMANWGVESLAPICPCTTLLHYGTIDQQGTVAVRLTFDHRVLDGSGASLALTEMEQVLKTEVLAELKALAAVVSEAGPSKAA